MLFESNAALTNIKITNTLEGNMADVDEDFKVKVHITCTNGTYTISGQDSSVTYGGSTITPSTTYTCGSDNYIYLKHGQEVYVGKNGSTNEIMSGVTYGVVEQDSTNYITEINSVSGKTLSNQTTSLSGNTVSIKNTYNNSVVTGVILKVLPYIILIAIVLTGLILLIVSKKKVKS